MKGFEYTIGLTATLGAGFATAFSSAEKQFDRMGSAIGDLVALEKKAAKAQGLRDKLGATAQEYKAVRLQMRKLAAQAKAGTGSPRIGAEMARAGAKADRLRTRLKQQSQTLHGLKKDFAAAGLSVRDFADNQVRAARVAAKLRPTHEHMASLRNQKKDLASRRSEKRGQFMETAVMGATVFAPISLAVDFESAMADVAKTVDGTRTDDGKLTQKFYDMGAAVRQMSREMPLATEEIAGLFAAGGQQGLGTIEKLKEFSTLSAEMAVAFDMSSDAAAEAIGGYRTALGLSMPETRSMLDLMNQFANTSSATEKSIAEVVSRVGGLGEVSGVSYKPMTALAATLTAMKVPPEIAATGIQKVMLALTRGGSATKKQSDAFARLGLNATVMAKRMQQDAPAAIIDVLSAIRKLSAHEQTEVMTNLFGQEGIKPIAAMTANIPLLSRNLRIAADESAYLGAVHKEFANRSATTANNIQLLKNRAKEMGVVIGTAVLPAVNAILVPIGAVFSGIADLADPCPLATKVIFGAAIGFAGAAVAAYAVGYAVCILKAGWVNLKLAAAGLRAGLVMLQASKMGVAVSSLTANTATTTLSLGMTRLKVAALGAGTSLKSAFIGSLGTARTAFASLFAMLPALGSGIAGIAAGFWSVTAAVLANPITWVVGGIIAAGIVLYKYWKPIKAFFLGFFGATSSAIKPVVNFVGAIAELTGVAWVFRVIGSGIEWVWGLLSDIGGLFGGLFDQADEGNAEEIGANLGNSLVEGVKNAFLYFTPVGWMYQGVTAAQEYLAGIDWSQAGQAAVGTLVSGLKSMALAPVNAVSNILGKVRQYLPFSDAKVGPLSTLTASGAAFATTFSGGMAKGQDKVEGQASSLAGAAGKGLRQVDAGPSLPGDVVAKLSSMALAPVNAVSHLLGKARQYLPFSGGMAKGQASSLEATAGKSGNANEAGSLRPRNGQQVVIHFSPTIHVEDGSGAEVRGQTEKALSLSLEQLRQMLEDLMNQERRVSYA